MVDTTKISIDDLNTSNIKIEPYSNKSFKIVGDTTELYKEQLSQFGGRFDPTLLGGGGFIFSINRLHILVTFVNQIRNKKIAPDDPSIITMKRRLT